MENGVKDLDSMYWEFNAKFSTIIKIDTIF